MSNLKDTDFDDLFRRASDKYPLRTDSADWDKMAATLDLDPTPAGFDGTGADDKRRKRRFFWLLLFLPLGGAGYYTWSHTGHGSSHPEIAVIAAPGNRQGAGTEGNTTQKVGQVHPSATNVVDASRAGVDGADGQQDVASKASGNANAGRGVASDRSAKGGSQLRRRNDNPAKGGSQSGLEDDYARAGGKNARVDGENPRADKNRFASAAVGGNVTTDGGATQPYFTAQPFSLKWAGDVGLARIATDYRLSVDVTAPPVVKSPDPEKPKKPKTSYLYAGLIVAPDISTVKMQSVKGVGTTFGLLVGYAFNSRWSIETGAYVDRKKYYTEGEYFDTKNIQLPAYSQLLNVNGTCYMWEIPLNVRYIFNPGGKMKWFATAGLSTYLMSSENYTYAYKSRIWTRDTVANIKKPSQYPFSIVNLSAGFEQSLGKVGNLRVEPYVRLPLEGIGTGKLPIMSAGVNIGITRRLW